MNLAGVRSKAPTSSLVVGPCRTIAWNIGWKIGYISATPLAKALTFMQSLYVI